MITRYYVKSVAHCDEQTGTVVLLDCSFIVSFSSSFISLATISLFRFTLTALIVSF